MIINFKLNHGQIKGKRPRPPFFLHLQNVFGMLTLLYCCMSWKVKFSFGRGGGQGSRAPSFWIFWMYPCKSTCWRFIPIDLCDNKGFNKSRLPAAVYHHLLTAVCLDFINENKNDINKQKHIQQQRRTLKFLNATKTARFWTPRTLEIAFPSF